jgi:hypothetical protein
VWEWEASWVSNRVTTELTSKQHTTMVVGSQSVGLRVGCER